jgi:hypothetical protein
MTNTGKAYVSWAVLLMPYIEQDSLYRQFNVNLPYGQQQPAATANHVKMYYCPTRRDPNELSTDTPPGGLSDYAGCTSDGDATGDNGALALGVVTVAADGVTLSNWRGQVTLSGRIPDGTSHTLLIGEKHIRFTTTFGTMEDASVYTSGNLPNSCRIAGRSSTNTLYVRSSTALTRSGIRKRSATGGSAAVTPAPVSSSCVTAVSGGSRLRSTLTP